MLFIALMVVAYSVKSFHTHPGKLPQKHAEHNVIHKSDASCSICDFHFSKDASDLTYFCEFVPADYLKRSAYKHKAAQRITSIGLASSDRGPPAIL